MNYLLTFNEGFKTQAAACITSICSNNSGENIFFILTDGLTEDTIARLQALAKRFGASISIKLIGDIELIFPNIDTKAWNPIILARLLMSRFLPENVNRILYLDCDTIVRNNLNELWCTTLDENEVIAAGIEPTVTQKTRNRLNLPQDCYYYNSGVLLVDLAKWRDQQIENKLIDYCYKNANSLVASDQDAINVVLQGKIHSLLPSYNYCNTYHYYPERFIRKLLRPLSYFSHDEYRKAISNPSIIHYLGEERPWRAGNKHEYVDDYIKYQSESGFHEYIENGWGLYFQLWNLFNTLVKPFPKARYSIITTLIPSFLKFRSKNR